MKYYEMTSPESLGIEREGIEKFLAACAHSGLELHRMMIVRHGKCCAVAEWAPYTVDDLHPIFSFSKSLTATAIGFAWQEGLLRLDERLVDLFPEDLPEEISENLSACTIHHLLCMSCGHETEITDRGPEWKKTFLDHPFLHAPGTFYKYNTAGTNMLAAIVKKKTGLHVTEYLRPRLLDPLGIEEIFCYQLPDELQTQHGGGGMKMRLEDMAKFAQFMLQDGCWEGKELLSGWYHAQAGVKQMETAGDSEGHVYEWANGYGYQCWMGCPERSFRADGAFGQFGLVYPTMDLCVMTNAATEQTQTMIDHVNDYLLPGVLPEGTALPESGEGAIIRKVQLKAFQSCKNPRFESLLAHAEYRPAKEGEALCGLAELAGGAGIFELEQGAITSLQFDFRKEKLILGFTEDGTKKELTAALDGTFAISEVDGIRYAASAGWRSLRRLDLELRRMDALSGVRLLLTFREDRLTIEADETLMTDGGLGMVDRHLVEFMQVADLSEVKVENTGNNPGDKH